jgi:hypothetical protein
MNCVILNPFDLCLIDHTSDELQQLARQHWVPSTILQGHIIAIHFENGLGVPGPAKMHSDLLHPSFNEVERKCLCIPNLGCVLSDAADQVCLTEFSEALDATDVLPELVFVHLDS